MRIAIATSVYYPMINGVAVFSHNLAIGLSRRGHEVLVLTPSQNKRAFSVSEDGVKISYLKSKELKIYPDQIHPAKKRGIFYKYGFKASLTPGREISKILDEFRPDVIHVQGSDPVGLSAVKYAHRHGIPAVLTEHNQPEVLTEPIHVPKFLRGGVNRILSAYFVNRERKVDYVTMPTKMSIDALVKGRDLGVPVEAVSNGVDLSSFKPGEAPESIYNIYGVPRDVPIILYVGRVDPEKKIDVTLRAFREFLDKHKLDEMSKTLFLVVGDGVAKNELVKLTSALGLSESVKFLGRIMPPELYNIYKVGDVFVTASEIETQGIVLIEAAAAGLPLIAVDAGAVAEVCKNSTNGFLLEPGDSRGISEAMTKILSDDPLKSRMSEASEKIAKEHSLERTIDKYIEIYEKLVKKGLKMAPGVIK